MEFGRRCQAKVTRQEEARGLAAKHDIMLEGLGGTEDGVIGALAAVGLAATADDGRIVQIQQQPDDLSGQQSVALLHARGVSAIVCEDYQVTSGTVDIGKHLRPSLRSGRVVLFVEPDVESGKDRGRAVRRL
jgi:hypothetical protein